MMYVWAGLTTACALRQFNDAKLAMDEALPFKALRACGTRVLFHLRRRVANRSTYLAWAMRQERSLS